MVAHRKALESLWTDRCTVTVSEKRQNPKTKRTEFDEVILHSDIPCRISYESIGSAGDGVVATVAQGVKLILSVDVDIPPGSKISIARGEIITDYTQSGVPARYSHHQEVRLMLWVGYA